VLRGAGRGEDAALSATAAFLCRDLVRHSCGFLFAFVASASNGLDASAKQYRFLADVLNNVSLALDMVSPLLPARLFLPSVCAGSVAGALCGVASGASRAALTAHFARAHNQADVAAKEGSQESLTTVVGMILGWVAVRCTSGSFPLQWALFLALTALHLYANASAMRALRLTSLNRERLGILAQEYVKGRVLTVEEVARRERLLPRFPPWLASISGARTLRIGAPLSALAPTQSASTGFPALQSHHAAFTAAPDAKHQNGWCIALARGSSAEDVAHAYAQVVAAFALRDSGLGCHPLKPASHGPLLWRSFLEDLKEGGWTCRFLMDGDEGHRVDWRRCD